MMEIASDAVSAELTHLFDPTVPQAQRCFGVLQGHLHGRIFTNDPAHPSWAVVCEPADHSIYFGGHLDAQIVDAVLQQVRRESEVLVGLWTDDARWGWMPPEPDYDGFAIDFANRVIGSHLIQHLTPPDGCEIRRVDAAMAARNPGFQDWCAHFGGVDVYLQGGVVYFMLKDGEIVSEASADPPVNGVMEMGTGTHEAHRRKGYATVVCAHTIRACEAMGCVTHWNCARQNLASAALAHKLGYQDEREYRVATWPKLPDEIQ